MRLSDAPVRRPVSDVQVLAVDAQGARRRPDRLVTEEPMEVRVAGPRQEPVPFAVAMRTPGNDFELAAGLCLTEGLVAGPDDIDGIAYCLGPEHEQMFNVVTVRLRSRVPDGVRERRYLSRLGGNVFDRFVQRQLVAIQGLVCALDGGDVGG